MQNQTDNQTATAAPEAPRHKRAEALIDVIVEGGVIQDIIGIPAGVEIQVIDHDTEGTPFNELTESPYDKEEMCVLTTWIHRPHIEGRVQ